MTIEKAMQRIGWRLGTGKPFQPNQGDIDAYNFIVEFVDKKQKQQLIDNQLFGKLYIYVFGQFMTYYKCSFDSVIPQKELHKLLDKDLRLILSDVIDKINISDMEYHLEKEKTLEGFKNAEYEEVAENLRIMVNGALNTFSKK